MLSVRTRAVFNTLRGMTRTVNKIQHSKRDLSKLSYFHAPGKQPLLPWTVGELINRAADSFGDTTAIVSTHQNISKTYTQYRRDVDQLAAGLVSLKLPMGSRVALLSPRLYEGAQLLYAASKAGLVMVGIHSFCTLHELEVCLNKAECTALILTETFLKKNYFEMLLQIAPELEKSALGDLNSQRLPFLRHVITIGDIRKPGCMTFGDLVNSATAEDDATMRSVSPKVQFDQDAFIQFSSGTTGQPKPVRLSHFNVVNNANLLGRVVGYHQQPETICLNADLIYGFGRTIGVLAATMFGSTVVMPGTVFAPKVVLEAIEKHRCTTVYGSPSMLSNIIRELEEGSYDVSSVRKGLVSGSLCPPATVEKAKTKLNVEKFYIMYGSAECSPIFSSTNPDEPTDRWIKTVGTPLDHVEVKVVDAQGRIVPVNTKGELCTRGPHVFRGYLNDDARTKEAIRDNWYHTGDEATISEEGRITFLGRIKEVIAHMAVNVSPLEIENLLNTHPDVEEAQEDLSKIKAWCKTWLAPSIDFKREVIGVPDESVGENICAWIKLKPDKTLTQEDIQAFCEGKIHSFKIPKFVLFVDTFPRTQTGKVQKHKMREDSKRLLNL